MTIPRRFTAVLFAVLIPALVLCSSFAIAGDEVREATPPPRLSLAEGQVSFWRQGAEDWVSARVNTPLAGGDALYTGERANLELQIGNRAFVRADEKTQIELTNQEPDYLQFKVTGGRASFDLRNLSAGHTVEVDTPNAAFTIEQTGYYVAEVDGDTTHFTTRRGGRAAVTPANGETKAIAPSEELIVKGEKRATVEVYAAPELDAWDRWNYDRTDQLIESLSSRYVPAGVYGVDDLDHYGTWRVVPTYGAVWVPDGLPSGWAPYSTGSWVHDPYYGWTWIDEAPWGWAPFHYGRWVSLSGYWAWAPGPIVVRPAYSPALVAFLGGGPRVSVSVNLGWVALGWGEPLFPWWGRAGFTGVAWWGGWGGPRVVNNVVVNHTTVISVNNITYQNTHVTNSVVAVQTNQFGHGPVRPAHVIDFSKLSGFAPLHGTLPIKPTPVSLTAGATHGTRPPEGLISRPVVATRPPHEVQLPWQSTQRPTTVTPHIITPQKRPEAVLSRPPFGANGGERPRPPMPPGFENRRGPGTVPQRMQEVPERMQERMQERASAQQERPAGAQQHRETRPFSRGETQSSPQGGFDRTFPRERPSQESRGPRVMQQETGSSQSWGGSRGQAFPRERGSQQQQALPGNPANRTYPRHQGRGEEGQGRRGQ